jgi:hypothetical protein
MRPRSLCCRCGFPLLERADQSPWWVALLVKGASGMCSGCIHSEASQVASGEPITDEADQSYSLTKERATERERGMR